MKKTIISLCAGFISVMAMAQDMPDLSASYTLWRPEGSTLAKEFKDGKKVDLTDKGGEINFRYTLSGMQGGGSLTPSWYGEAMCKSQWKYTSVRFCNSGPTSYNWGGQLLEVEQGVLVIGEMNYNLSVSGECSQTGLKGISAILLRDESKKNTLSISTIKAKCNELLEAMCKVMKSKNPETRDLRGLASVASTAADFSSSKKIDGTYYTYRNPDVTAHPIYGECKTADITDNGEQIVINSKFMGVKKIAVTFHLDKQLLEIEKKGGHKIMRSDPVTEQYKFGNAWLVEIEEGVIVIATYIDMDWTFESNCKASADNICYVFFKDKSKCSNMALGEIKTKFKTVLGEMCAAYQKGLNAPTSSVKVVLPEHKNTEANLETQAWTAIQQYSKRMGWKETLTGCYVASENWIPVTKKEFINNSYIDVVKGRQKYCIVFFKTDKGLYKSEGFSIQQDAVAGDYSGKNFVTSIYVSGILDGLPGSGWNTQVVDKKDADTYKK